MKLENKVIAITGAGGIICSEFAKALAKEGAKVALLDINYDAAKQYADEIGENAIAIRCNCLDKENIIQAQKEINESFGKVNFLINGAGGNNPKATCDHEYFNSEDCYYLMLTRADDGVVLPTCEVCPGLDTPIENVLADKDLLNLTLLDRAQRVYVGDSFVGNVFVYTLTGQLLDVFEIDENTPCFVSPNQVGIYMLYFVTQDYNVGYKIHVR